MVVEEVMKQGVEVVFGSSVLDMKEKINNAIALLAVENKTVSNVSMSTVCDPMANSNAKFSFYAAILWSSLT